MSSPDADPPSLYAAREPIFPKAVSGPFRRLKWIIMGLTLAIYYITPWIRWDRGPGVPDQAVLVDLANRRFFFFWIEIWPHEFYFVAGLLVMAGLGLFLFTSALGRVWCGYTCPQTVWTDLYVHVERWIEGDRNARLRLHRQALNGEKIRKRAVKWTVWLLIGLATGGAWVFYFTDAPTLLRALLTGQAHPVAYVTIAVLTATTFIFGGFMREQICVYACPWPRIQGAMMDEDTLTVAYLSDDEYRRRYELYLVKEMAHQRKGNKIAVVYNHDCEGIEELADYPVQIKVGADMENVLLGLDFILFAQTIALMKSLSLGITPDNPCPTGEVNRVVKGVTLYPYTLK